MQRPDDWTLKTDSSPRVSIIIIFLNAQQFLREAIESVFSQGYQDWELLLVDDGSTDSSTQIARDYAGRHPTRVRYLSHDRRENRGMSASRNMGIAHAGGEFVAFLDSDDVWFPHKLEQQVAILERYPQAAMVIGAIQWWYSWTGNDGDAGRDFVPAPSFGPEGVVDPPQLLVRLLKKDTATTTPGLLRRAAINRLGGFEEDFRGMYEDQAFFAKVSTNCAVYVSNDCYYRWRKHEDSSCSRSVSNGEYRTARLKFLLWLQKYLAQQSPVDLDLSRTLREYLWKCRHPLLNRVWGRV